MAGTTFVDFPARPGYLNSATCGVPPSSALGAMQADLAAWGAGAVSGPDYDVPVGRARAAWARMHGVQVGDVAIGTQAAGLVGLIAASLPAGARVLCAEDDFTSVTYPLLVQAATGRGVQVRAVPLERIPEAVEPGDALVAVSVAQSADGRLVDLDALASCADGHGVPVLLDATQASGWLPLDASRFAYVVCHAYKWLCSPRGAAFLAVRPERRDAIVPAGAGWYAAERPWASIYGTELRLAADARRFDTSPAWSAWVGTAAALEALEAVGPDRIHAHDVGLADAFRAALGLEPAGSAIVSVAAQGAAERLAAAGVQAAVRAGRARLSFHLYNDHDDVERAVRALA